ncbi:MAG TPA: Hsp20/alpha crystallin family protein [Anaerolineae bacterium]
MLTRSIVIRDPFANMVNRFMNDSLFRPSREWATVWGIGSRLPIDVYEDGEGYTLVAIAPGVKADELSIETEGNAIKLSGEFIAPAASADQDVQTLRNEIGYGKFSRSFELPEDIEADKIEAKLENGVLIVRVPKAEAVKPRSIKVQAK